MRKSSDGHFLWTLLRGPHFFNAHIAVERFLGRLLNSDHTRLILARHVENRCTSTTSKKKI